MILFVTNADTEILTLRVVAEMLPEGLGPLIAANPSRLVETPDLAGVRMVLVRLLGGRQAWETPFDELRGRCLAAGIPLLAFGGEAVPDAELAGASTVPSGILAEAMGYLTYGGVENLVNLVRFLGDTVLVEGNGFEPPREIPSCGIWREWRDGSGRPLVAVVFYRAHVLAGNTQFVEDLCEAISAAGCDAIAVYAYSLRSGSDGLADLSSELAARGVDALITTTLAAGTFSDDSANWDPGALSRLDVPVLQGICATSSSAAWRGSTGGLVPQDVAMSIAIPEFDGRIIAVPFSFKEVVDDAEVIGTEVTAYRSLPDRVDRLASLGARLAALSQTPVADRRVALVLSAYPTKRSRLGNAVGLDTPASVIGLLNAMAGAGYTLDELPGSGDELMASLADGLVYAESPVQTPDGQVAEPLGSMSAASYVEWFSGLPEDLRERVCSAWGPPPGTVGLKEVDGVAGLVFSGLRLGNIVVAIQPPRGFGEDPVAVYHSPDLPPTHHYLAFYRWLDDVFRADALVHVGKHGTLEWLPGKGSGMSASCGPDAALGSIPVIYPFVVNDPGEGAQAKRRTHAVIIDHLVPPLTRADAYDEIVELESLLDDHASVASLDPSKLPAIRKKVWECLVAAEIHRDLGLGTRREAPTGDGRFDDPSFDDLLVEIDGYLCELKDAQIRGGLHVLGVPPSGSAEVDMVLAITRLAQGEIPSLRVAVAGALGIDLASGRRAEVDRVEEECRRLLVGCQEAGWDLSGLGLSAWGLDAEVDKVLRWVCGRLVGDLRATTAEIDALLGALDGHFVAPGPSGAPSRGQAHVLPTGRNFYTLDPRALPSRLAWDVGRALAEDLCRRHLEEEGRYPRSVGLVVWGTSAMRTGGDDIAQALALLGCRPRWAPESGRIEGVEVIGLDDLGRPRVDVTLRISGFFRDAFPHVIALFDEAVEKVAMMPEPEELNPLRALGAPDDPRIFGPKPGAYGSGILEVIESGNWRSDDDLAAVYLAWGGWSYTREAMGVQAEEALRRRLSSVEVAVKNQDNREHDIFDSDDYLQDHGGMVAAIRALRGSGPKAWFGDSSDPARPRVRSLAQEAARVVRSRVLNPKWIEAMTHHGYKGAFEMSATVDYLFGYDATAHVVEDWMYERVCAAYVGDERVRKFFEASNPWALRAITERLLEAAERSMWDASDEALATLRSGLLQAEGWEEERAAPTRDDARPSGPASRHRPHGGEGSTP